MDRSGPPTVAWYAVIPETPDTSDSTFWVSASVSVSVEFSGIVMVIGNVGLEDWSRRLTRKRGIRAIDAAKKAAAAPIVRSLWLVAQRIVGT